MKSVALVSLNSSWSQSNLALYYLREMIRDLPYRVLMQAYSINEPLMQILQGIVAVKPDVICFSCYIWNREMVSCLCQAIPKILPQVVIVLGGPEAGRIPGDKNIMRILGSGEAAFRALAIEGFEKLAEAEAIPLSSVPYPYHPEDKETLQDHLVYYETYRGCPYHCDYCLSATDERRDSRFDLDKQEDKKRLQAELDALIVLQPRTVKFIDRSFNFCKAQASWIWEYVISAECTCDFHFEIYPDLLTEADIDLLAKAPEGRIRLEVGVQTTNDVVNRDCGRQSQWQKAKQALLELKRRTRVRIHADLLAGLPGEDLSSVIRSLDDLCACQPDAIQLGFLKILPDTPMYDKAQSLGYEWLDTPPYQVLASDCLSFADLSHLDEYAHLLGLYWNKQEFVPQWSALLLNHTASWVLDRLRELHNQAGISLHSVSRADRFRIMQSLMDHLY